MIDLRSDTVTRPTPDMLQAMMRAPVGDDVIDIDPTVVQLQEKTAELLGKEAAIFMPSGTMTNQIALRVHCSPGDEFLCETECHIYNYEQGAFAQLSGLVARTIPGHCGVFGLDQLDGMVRPDNEHMVRTRLICLENTSNRGGGSIFPQSLVESICAWAKHHGLCSHLDGARLFNAAVATGRSVGELAAPFDSVSVCFSKGLGAPVGSCLAGTKEFVAKARRARKLFGGGMRQAGYLAAAALYALEHHVDRLAVDHAHANRLAETVQELEGLHLLGGSVETNIVIFKIEPKLGTAADFARRLLEEGVQVMAFGPQSIRMVTHLDLSASDIETACSAMRRLLGR
ncbi:MAG: beta-eliminating lyase-related protein [Pirellula sp.]|nr:beta-eliminating lyase-related protein [Pirellula sp.]